MLGLHVKLFNTKRCCRFCCFDDVGIAWNMCSNASVHAASTNGKIYCFNWKRRLSSLWLPLHLIWLLIVSGKVGREEAGAGFGPVVYQKDPEKVWNVDSDGDHPLFLLPLVMGKQTKHNLGDSEARCWQSLMCHMLLGDYVKMKIPIKGSGLGAGGCGEAQILQFKEASK